MKKSTIARNQIVIALRMCEEGMDNLPSVAYGTLKIVYGMMLMARSCDHITQASAGRISRIIECMQTKIERMPDVSL